MFGCAYPPLSSLFWSSTSLIFSQQARNVSLLDYFSSILVSELHWSQLGLKVISNQLRRLFSLAMAMPHSFILLHFQWSCVLNPSKVNISCHLITRKLFHGTLRSALCATDCSTDMRKLPSTLLISSMSFFLSSYLQVWISCVSWVVSSPALTAKQMFARECDLFRIVRGAAFPDGT